MQARILKAITKSLERFRHQEEEIRLQWERDEDGWRKLPARAWPEYQPNVEDIPFIEQALFKTCVKMPDGTFIVPGLLYFNRSIQRTKTCENSIFELATSLVFNGIDGVTGLKYQLS